MKRGQRKQTADVIESVLTLLCATLLKQSIAETKLLYSACKHTHHAGMMLTMTAESLGLQFGSMNLMMATDKVITVRPEVEHECPECHFNTLKAQKLPQN